MAAEPAQPAVVNANVTPATGKWTRWKAISRQRAPERTRSRRRPNHDVAVNAGTGSPMRTPAIAAIRDRSILPNPRDSTNSIQANGNASTNVISSGAVEARNATTNVNVIAAVTNPVTS